MNLLILSPWFPYPPDNGSRLRAFHLIREMAKTHRVRLVTGLQEDIASVAMPDGKTVPAPLAELCESVTVTRWQWHKGDDGSRVAKVRSAVRALLSPTPRSILETDMPELRQAIETELTRRPDAVLAMELAIAPFVPKDTHGLPILLDQIEVTGVRRVYHEAQGAKARLRAGLTLVKHDRYWRRALQRFDGITAVSEEEASAIRQVLGTRPPVHLVPNGVDTSAYPALPDNHEPVPGRMLYNGALTYGPNRDAVYWFVQEILPIIANAVPEAHLIVTGRYPEEAGRLLGGNPRVQLTGFLPDLKDALSEAAVCVVPLKAGGGTRLKILEAFAAQLPVVSTAIGASGIAGVDGEHLRLAETPETIAQATIDLLTNRAERRRLIANARALVLDRYEWTAIGLTMNDLLTDLQRQKP